MWRPRFTAVLVSRGRCYSWDLQARQRVGGPQRGHPASCQALLRSRCRKVRRAASSGCGRWRGEPNHDRATRGEPRLEARWGVSRSVAGDEGSRWPGEASADDHREVGAESPDDAPRVQGAVARRYAVRRRPPALSKPVRRRTARCRRVRRGQIQVRAPGRVGGARSCPTGTPWRIGSAPHACRARTGSWMGGSRSWRVRRASLVERSRGGRHCDRGAAEKRRATAAMSSATIGFTVVI
jgi:hypothetical protein